MEHFFDSNTIKLITTLKLNINYICILIVFWHTLPFPFIASQPTSVSPFWFEYTPNKPFWFLVGAFNIITPHESGYSWPIYVYELNKYVYTFIVKKSNEFLSRYVTKCFTLIYLQQFWLFCFFKMKALENERMWKDKIFHICCYQLSLSNAHEICNECVCTS